MHLKLLVTGSVGFVGNSFIKSILSKTAHDDKMVYTINTIDNMVFKESFYNSFENRDNKFHLADVCNKDQMSKIFKLSNPDIVIHFAGKTKYEECEADRAGCIATNNLGLQNVLDLSLEHKVSRFIYTSSYKVYGANASQTNEDAQISSDTTYALSKAMGESQVKFACKNSSMDYLILRPCNLFGMRQRADFIIPKTVKSILSKKKVTLYGDGSDSREWLSVNEFVKAMKFLIQKDAVNETFNVSANHELSLLEIVQRVHNVLNVKMDVEFIPRISQSYTADVSKLKSIGWKSEPKFKEAFEQTVSWYNANPWWLK